MYLFYDQADQNNMIYTQCKSIQCVIYYGNYFGNGNVMIVLQDCIIDSYITMFVCF